MQRDDTIWQAIAGVAVLCLVVITIVLVKREFFETDVAFASVPGDEKRLEAVPVNDWDRVKNGGHRMGPADAPVTIVEFSDFQCPACARFANNVFPTLEEVFPGKLSLVYRHWPLRMHPYAYPAARAAECAAAQGRFEVFHDLLFQQRDSLGSKPFTQFAREAHVPDVAQFDRCASSTAPVPAVEADMAEARRIGGTGTPTLVINGILLRPPYSPKAVTEQIRAALDRRN
jgi:protein-disulfide isomerase